jgi:hypothetical protein
VELAPLPSGGTQQVFLQGYADLGGFSVDAKSDWQLSGVLAYQYTPKIAFVGGWGRLSLSEART